jgi:putative DNA primase/helicase
MTITREQRWTKDNPCPICGGHDGLPRGQQRRCAGFLSADGKWAHCTREEFAGNLKPTNATPPTWAHLLTSECGCGRTHGLPDIGDSGAGRSKNTGSAKGRIVEIYDYLDEDRALLFQVVRLDPKGFFQRRPDGNGGWIHNLKGVQRVLYRLPELCAADPSELVFVCEGEKDVDRLSREGLLATTNPGGAGKWRKEYSAELRGRSVVAVPDNDAAGLAGAEKVARSLTEVAKSVAVLQLAGLSGGEDVSDWLDQGHTVEELAKLAKEAAASIPAGNRANLGGDARPQIIIRGNLPEIVDEAISAIKWCEQAELYQRAHLLVRVLRDPELPTRGIARPPDTPVIQHIPNGALREKMAIAARWCRWDDRTCSLSPALPPSWAVTALAERGEWPFRRLEGVVEAPCLRQDGTVLDQSGYDPATGLLFEPGAAKFHAVAPEPSREDALRGLGAILEALYDFPFAGNRTSPPPASPQRSAALAAILTPFARYAIEGPVPMFAIRSPTPGTGKSLLADVVALLLTGRPAARMVTGGGVEEERKRVLSIGLEGTPLVLLDNVEELLGSSALAAVLTADTFSDRLLGKNQTVTVPVHAIWLATGNNLSFRGDLGRRVLPIDLDAEEEHPEERGGFRHPELLNWIRTERERLVQAVLTILRAWSVACQPQPQLQRFGSFESWSRVIRAPLVWLGEPDPLLARSSIRETSDPEIAAIRVALEAWYEEFQEYPKTLAEAAARATVSDPLRSALGELDDRFDGYRPNPKNVGYVFRRYADLIIGGLQLLRTGASSGGQRWSVRRVCPGREDGGDDGGDNDDVSRRQFPTPLTLFPSESCLLE